jgi:hypothetical protein
MCPGASYNGCRDQNPAVIEKVYCAECQLIIDRHNSSPQHHASVIRCKEKKTERDKGIFMVTPIPLSLETTPFQHLLSPDVIQKLKQPAAIICCDSEAYAKSHDSADTYMWSFYDSESRTANGESVGVIRESAFITKFNSSSLAPMRTPVSGYFFCLISTKRRRKLLWFKLCKI